MSERALVGTEILAEGAILRLVLESPPGNVLDRKLIGVLDAILARPLPPQARMLLLEGAGKHFSFGASVPEHVKEMAGELLPAFHRLIGRLVDLPVATAALVRGQCLGGGLELAAACDFLFVEDNAMLAVPEIKLGVFPPAASVLLSWRIGGGRASEMILTGRTVDSKLALEWGLATASYAAGSGLEEVKRWVEKHLVPHSASSIGAAAKAARLSLTRRVKDDLPLLEKVYLDDLMRTHDANEGIASFLEKRKPAWSHR